jgi:hypothetical protein
MEPSKLKGHAPPGPVSTTTLVSNGVLVSEAPVSETLVSRPPPSDVDESTVMVASLRPRERLRLLQAAVVTTKTARRRRERMKDGFITPRGYPLRSYPLNPASDQASSAPMLAVV